jgi:hypothetical protein
VFSVCDLAAQASAEKPESFASSSGEVFSMGQPRFRPDAKTAKAVSENPSGFFAFPGFEKRKIAERYAAGETMAEPARE